MSFWLTVNIEVNTEEAETQLEAANRMLRVLKDSGFKVRDSMFRKEDKDENDI